MNEFCIECNNDFETFWEKRKDHIDSIDIENLKYKALHVTTNWDDCFETKTYGILDL